MSSPLKWLGGKIDIRVQVATDLDPSGSGVWGVSKWGTGFWSAPDLSFQDITEYVMSVDIGRGQDRWESRYRAGSCRITLDNSTGIFSPDSGLGLWGVPFRPGRLVRVLAVPDPTAPTTTVSLFTGRIDSANDEFKDAGGDIVTVVTALDALADLHAMNPIALETATGVELSSVRVNSALDNVSWPDEARLIQLGNHNVQTSFLAQTVLEEVARAAEAEGGALYADADNNIVFKSRDWLQGGQALMDDYEAATVAKAPLAYWRFEGATATADEIGTHTLTFNGTPTKEVTGVLSDDDAVSFDGTDDYATVANEGDLELEADMSIEMWVRPHDVSGSAQAILSCRDGSGPLYEVFYDPDDESLQFYPNSSASQGFELPVLPANEWTHIVVTIDWHESHRDIAFYANGERWYYLLANYQPSMSSPVINIGRRAVVNDLYFDGDISELAIYDFVLTDEQVLHQYQAKDTSLNDRSLIPQGYLGYDDTLLDLMLDHATTATFKEVVEAPWVLTFQYVSEDDDDYVWNDMLALTGTGYASIDVDEDADELIVYGPTDTDETVIGTFDETNHVWQRMFNDGESIYYYTAPAEAGPWTLQHTVTVPESSIGSSWEVGLDDDTDYDNVTLSGPVNRADIIAVTTSHETARIVNDVQFARSGGTVQSASDADSIASFGRRSTQRLDYINNSDSDVEFLADRYLNAYKDNRVRVDSVTISANDDPDNEDLNRLFYGALFGDLVKVKVRTLHGWSFAKETHIIGVQHMITPDDWVVTFTLDDAALFAAAEESSSSSS